MSKIAAVTDSIACIPIDLVKKHNILVAPVPTRGLWDWLFITNSVYLSLRY